MTISPQHLFSLGRARWIKKRRLRRQHKGLFGFAPIGHGEFGRRDFLERSAQVHRDRSPAIRCAPRNRLGERVIDFERARRELEPFQFTFVFRRKALAGNRNQLPRRGVEKHQLAARFQLAECRRIDAAGGVHCSAQRLQVANERLGDGLRASARNGPSDRVNGDPEHPSDGRAQRLVEAQKRVTRHSREDGPRARADEMALGEALRGLNRRKSKSRHAQRMMRDAQCRPKCVFSKPHPVVGRWLHQAPP